MLRRLLPVLLVASLGIPAAGVAATGAWLQDVQYSYADPGTSLLITPFVDAEGSPWVLANNVETFACELIGPFGQPGGHATTAFRVEDDEGNDLDSECLTVIPGPDGGFFVRGQIPSPPPPAPEVPPKGFLVLLDSEFNVVWRHFDEEFTERGVYGGPLPQVAWSEDIGRVVTFFQGSVVIGTETGTQLHGLSIAESTGLVRRVITSWGSFSAGELRGLEVVEETGDFLVVGHSSGTDFLLYNGLESIDAFPAGDSIDWSTRDVAAVQAVGDSVYVSHFPRLDFEGIDTNLARYNVDGTIEYYDESLGRIVTLTNQETQQQFDFEFARPILSYFTDTTATFVRGAPGDFVLHTYDNFVGEEWALQSLSTIDENQPTHVSSAGAGDRLLLLTAGDVEGTLFRYINVMTWDPDAETPPGYPQLEEDNTGGDTGVGGDTGPGGDAGGNPDADGSGDDGGDGGGCQTASSPAGAWLIVLALCVVAIIPRRAARVR